MAVRRVVANLRVDDFAACRVFYSGLLGLDVAMDLGWILTFASPANPTAQLNVFGAGAGAGAGAPPASLQPALSIDVDDVDAVYAEAVQSGVAIALPLTDEPWGVRRFFAYDPSGNVVNVLSHQPAPEERRI